MGYSMPAPLIPAGQGAWGHIGIRHFHPNTHECYGTVVSTLAAEDVGRLILAGIVSGRSTMLLGKINDGTGVHVQVQRGDVIVLPAGTAHSSIESTPDYFYIGVYPRVRSTAWRTLSRVAHGADKVDSAIRGG